MKPRKAWWLFFFVLSFVAFSSVSLSAETSHEPPGKWISNEDFLQLKKISATLEEVFRLSRVSLEKLPNYLEELQQSLQRSELILTSERMRAESLRTSLEELRADTQTRIRTAENEAYWRGFRDGGIIVGLGSAAGAGAIGYAVGRAFD